MHKAKNNGKYFLFVNIAGKNVYIRKISLY